MNNKKIVILGGGESGVGSAILAQKEGFDVFLTDSSEIKPKYQEALSAHHIDFESGHHTEERILNADEIIKSPGVPETAPIIVKLKSQGTHIISEIEFAGRYTDAKMICITGSNGKTTTTMLTYHILKSAGINVGLAGNVGQSLAWQVAEKHFDCYVVELSSFQLDNMYDFKADIAILLNITPDHLDRYDFKFQNYIDAKFRIIQNQTEKDAFIYWDDDPVIQKELKKRKINATAYPFSLEKKPGVRAFVENLELVILTLKNEFRMPVIELSLAGTHNTYNSMAAGISANLMNITNESLRKSLSDFAGVEHRLEYVATVRGVKFINDSKATNVNSCWYALKSMTTPTVLILGGKDKGNDYSEIEDLVKEKVHTLIFMGLHNEKLHEFFDGKVKTIYDTQDVKDAVQKGLEFAHRGDTVLLSPCCASFDLFKSYEDRGDQFKQCVKNL